MIIDITQAERKLIEHALADHAATLMQISYQWKIVKTGRGNLLQEDAQTCLRLAHEIAAADTIMVIP